MYDRGLRIWKERAWDPDSDLTIGWKYSGTIRPFVTYHKDGTTTIQADSTPSQGGWYGWTPLRSQSVRLTIVRYSGITSLYQRNYKHYIVDKNYDVSPSKIQGCRMCRQSGKVDSWCSPTTCWSGGFNEPRNEEGNLTFSCPDHTDASVVNPWARYHYVPCEHGEKQGHTVPKGQTCYGCSGTGKRDYGNKPIPLMWDGSPLRLRDGNVIKEPATLLERMIANYVQPVG